MADHSQIAAPTIRLELRNGAGRPAVHAVTSHDFVIGSAPGSDLRLTGTNVPPVVAVIARLPGSVRIRKLAATLPLQLNGRDLSSAELHSGDLLTLGPMTILVAVNAGAPRPIEVKFAPIPLAPEPLEVPNTLDAERDDLTEQKRELYRRYQERRDRLAGLQQAVDVAAKNLQEQKRRFDADVKNTAPVLRDLERRQAEIEQRERASAADEDTIVRAKLQLDDELQQLHDSREEHAARERTLIEREAQFQADLVRLDRRVGEADRRDQELLARVAECDRRTGDAQSRTGTLDEQARELESANQRQRAQAEQLLRLQGELEDRTARLAEREKAVEGQQSQLGTLHSRLERTRGEVRKEAGLLVEQRARQDAAERSIQEQTRQLERLRSEFAGEQQAHFANAQEFESRSAKLQEAVGHLRQVEERLTTESTALQSRRDVLEVQAAEQAQLAAEMQARAVQLADVEQRLAPLTPDDEQRVAALAAREQQLAEAAELQIAAATEIEDLRATMVKARDEIEAQWQTLRGESEGRSAALDAREETLRRHIEKLRTVGAAVAAERKSSFVAQERWAVEQQALTAEADALRMELDAFRARTAEDSDELQRRLPELELRGDAALARLAQAREQLRAHVAELHQYTRQSQNDLQTLRARIQADYERLRAQELTVQRERTEHRLAVTAFRQQLIEWQGRIAEIRQSLVHDGTRLEWKQAEVDAAARQIDATSQQLARQAADLSAQEREVAERRTEVERHLQDMREWYRHKLRDLADSAPNDDSSAVLPIADELEPGDRQLGELLRSLDLVEPDTLAALLQESRRQRRSLRQVLLSSRDAGSPLLTLYQLALIEAGNLDGLVLGPLRVVDRLAVNPRETVYRVFDPRSGTPAILRHLADAEVQIAGRADDFERRFAAVTALRHDNLAETFEVMEIQGRPAVLQEWVTGLSATDWPAAAGAPGVWFRLMMQCTLALDAAHRAGIVHGHVSPRAVLLTSVGVVKVIGFGDPPWLAGVEDEGTVAGDLIALGGLAASWAALSPRRRGGKSPKPLPAPLRSVLESLGPGATEPFTSAAEVLQALQRAGHKIPDASAAWDELLDHASSSGSEPVVWRKSA